MERNFFLTDRCQRIFVCVSKLKEKEIDRLRKEKLIVYEWDFYLSISGVLNNPRLLVSILDLVSCC